MMSRIAVGVLAAVLMGCGVPGEPLPPLLEIPEPVHDLSAEQVGARLTLRFTRPQLTTEGTLIRFLDRMEIHGAFLPPDASPETFAEQARLVATLASAQIPAEAGQLSYDLPLEASQRGTKAVFAVKAINHREKDAGFSNLATVEITDLPEAPTRLRAILTEPAIQLSWTPAERSAFGGAAPMPEGYEVYRTDAGSPAPAALLATTPSPFYEDTSFAFGASYTYYVRAFARRGESTARTPESSSVEVAAVDRFPPASPQNLRAVPVPGAVELAWSPNAETDLAGYHLYRSAGSNFVRVNAVLLLLPLYRDTNVQAGNEYRYQVKAVDRNGNEGPPSGEASATAE
ncbi:MAG: hypothetical protein HY316_06535 [Acidobacteria bacterium]|nr:hypothetical protein [Acidobacteriota bacterium]